MLERATRPSSSIVASPLRSTARHSAPRFHPSPAAPTPTRRPPLATLCLACQPPRQVAPPTKTNSQHRPRVCLLSARWVPHDSPSESARPASAKLAGLRSSWRFRSRGPKMRVFECPRFSYTRFEHDFGPKTGFVQASPRTSLLTVNSLGSWKPRILHAESGKRVFAGPGSGGDRHPWIGCDRD